MSEDKAKVAVSQNEEKKPHYTLQAHSARHVLAAVKKPVKQEEKKDNG